MFDDIDVSGVVDEIPPDMDWDYIKRLKDTTTMKLFLKGIVTGEDAELSVENGVDGIIVSNHGGRNEASDRSTIECLPEIVEAVSGRILVIIDGGFRRGTDIFKALALGANAIAIGRPYLWGLSAFGRRVWKQFWKFYAASSRGSCDRRAQPRSRKSHVPTSWMVRS